MITLMLNQNDIPSLTSFDGNIDADKLKPYIYLSQKNELKRILGNSLYNKMYGDYKEGTLAGVYETIYNEYVIDILVFFSCSKYMAFGGYKTSNNGITKVNFAGAIAVDYKEVNILIARYNQLAANAEQSFLEYMEDPETPEVIEYKRKGEDRETNKVIQWY